MDLRRSLWSADSRSSGGDLLLLLDLVVFVLFLLMYIPFCYMYIISVPFIRPSRLGFVYNGPLSKFSIQGLFWIVDNSSEIDIYRVFLFSTG